MGLGLMLALTGLAPAPDVGQSYLVPYRLTQTNHYLVRVKVNGKGPFNFLVDTGAPALYVGTEVARKVGLEPSKTDYWTVVDRLELEGGARLDAIKARIDDPFQLTGMNALGLPGVSIDGILGFTVLARFRMEFDPTRDRMTWTRLDYEPKEPFIPPNMRKADQPAEMQAMDALGPLAKFAAMFIGKQPEDKLIPRGYLGLELAEADGGLKVARVFVGSPADRAGVRAGDDLVRLLDQTPSGLAAALEAVAKVEPGGRVPISVRRGGQTLDLSLTAGEGL